MVYVQSRCEGTTIVNLTSKYNLFKNSYKYHETCLIKSLPRNSKCPTYNVRSIPNPSLSTQQVPLEVVYILFCRGSLVLKISILYLKFHGCVMHFSTCEGMGLFAQPCIFQEEAGRRLYRALDAHDPNTNQASIICSVPSTCSSRCFLHP